MSLSPETPVKITFNTAQDISNEILGSAIKFCMETGYKQNITTLTFFWTAFLLPFKGTLNKYNLITDIMRCYTHSLSKVFPDFMVDPTMRNRVNEKLQHYWNNLSNNFQSLNTPSEMSNLFRIANSLASFDDNITSYSLKRNPQQFFSQIVSTISSNIYCILRQINNPYIIQYSGILNEFQFSKHHSANNRNTTQKHYPHNNHAPHYHSEIKRKPLGMMWYTFLVSFALIAGAVINSISSLGFLTGSIYTVWSNTTAEKVYLQYGNGLRILDMTYGFLLIVIVILTIVLRNKLVNFESDAPKFVVFFYSLLVILPLSYTLIGSAITELPISTNAIASLIASLLLLFANIRYFRRRSYLFTKDTVSQHPDYAAYEAPPYQEATFTPSVNTKNTTRSFPIKPVLIIAAIIGGILIIANLLSNPDQKLEPLAEPRSGTILLGNEDPYGSEITITAPRSESCVVKLKNTSGVTRLSFYVRAGDTVTIGVPPEYLYVYFATGKTWYGFTDLFGKHTSYSKDDELCDFTEYSWEYTLYPVSSGNFSQTPINENEFK